MFDFRVIGTPLSPVVGQIFNKIDHNTIGNVRVPVRKYKMVSKIDILPAILLGLGFHRIDIGIMRSDGVICADTLFYIDIIEKFSVVDLAILILTHGAGSVIKTAMDIASKADAIRALLKLIVDNFKSISPDTSDWDSKWTDFKRAKFNYPSELIGIGKSIDWTCKVSIISALTLGCGWNGFSFYGLNGGVKLLVPNPNDSIDFLKSLLHPIPGLPGKETPIAEISDWSFIAKLPIAHMIKLMTKRGTSAQDMLDLELSDYIGELSSAQGTGLWMSVEQTAAFITSHLIPWFEQVSNYIVNIFDEIIDYLFSKKELNSRSGYYHIVRNSQQGISIINHDPTDKHGDLDYQKIYSPGQAPLLMK